jgi:hypothetical protein
MGNNSEDNRYDLPDDWNVTDYVCAVIPVPNDPQYIAMLRGLLDTLTWQRSFRKHSTENAAFQVSKTWQNCFLSQEWLFTDCEAIVIDVRQNPEDPCELDKETVDGEWTEFADLQLCPPQLSVSPDGTLQWWNPACNDGAGCWEELPPPADFGDDSEPPVTPPFPPGTPEYEDNTAFCIAAANIADALKNLIRAIIDGFFAIEGASVWTFLAITVVTFILAPEIALPVAAAMIVLAALIIETNLDADFASFDWEELRDRIACVLNRDGSMSNAEKNDLITRNADWDYPATNQIGWILHDLLQLIPSSVITYLGTIAQSDIEPTCAECAEWCHTFDFTIDEQGFEAWYLSTPTPVVGPRALYVSGHGWTANFATWGCAAQIQRVFSAHVTSIKVWVTEGGTTWQGQSPSFDDGTEWQEIISNGEDHVHFEVNTDINGLWFSHGIVYPEPCTSEGGYTQYVYKMEICGTGDEPAW